MLVFPVANLLPPSGASCRIAIAMSRSQIMQHLIQLLQHAFDVADDGKIGNAVLADLGRIDVHVNHFGVWGKGRQAAGNPIVEPHA